MIFCLRVASSTVFALVAFLLDGSILSYNIVRTGCPCFKSLGVLVGERSCRTINLITCILYLTILFPYIHDVLMDSRPSSRLLMFLFHLSILLCFQLGFFYRRVCILVNCYECNTLSPPCPPLQKECMLVLVLYLAAYFLSGQINHLAEVTTQAEETTVTTQAEETTTTLEPTTTQLICGNGGTPRPNGQRCDCLVQYGGRTCHRLIRGTIIYLSLLKIILLLTDWTIGLMSDWMNS